jgi:CheY-like chemotaxis protein
MPFAVANDAPHTVFKPGILVVDDDAALLNLLRLVLTNRGFQVWVASNGEAALALYEQQRAQIHLVLMDVCMPGQDGPQTLAAMRQLNPDLSCSFMSGYTGRYDTKALQSLGAVHFFGKPFRVQEMAETLWQTVRRLESLSA